MGRTRPPLGTVARDHLLFALDFAGWPQTASSSNCTTSRTFLRSIRCVSEPAQRTFQDRVPSVRAEALHPLLLHAALTSRCSYARRASTKLSPRYWAKANSQQELASIRIRPAVSAPRPSRPLSCAPSLRSPHSTTGLMRRSRSPMERPNQFAHGRPTAIPHQSLPCTQTPKQTRSQPTQHSSLPRPQATIRLARSPWRRTLQLRRSRLNKAMTNSPAGQAPT